MGLSETIVAAIIGALATMGTAIFQLIRNRAPSETRPKKNRTRSVIATIALMIGCIVGGYAWSALRAVSAREEIAAAMEEQYKKQFAEFVASQNSKSALVAEPAGGGGGSAIAARHGEAGSADVVAHLPPCPVNAQPDEVGPVLCTDPVAPRIELCATVPAATQTAGVRVEARVPKSETAWIEREAGAANIGSVRVIGEPVEYPVSADRRSVCQSVSNWSVEDTMAVRITVDYVHGADPNASLTAATPSAHTL